MILNHLSVDCVIFGFHANKLKVLLWQAEPGLLKKFLSSEEEHTQIEMLFNKNPALRSDNYWGLIGTHLPADESLDEYAKKIVQIATGLDHIFLKQFHTFGNLNRVPHYRVLTVAYYSLINPSYHDLKQSAVAKNVQWFDIENLPDVIFDVRDIIQKALKNLRDEAKYYPVGYYLLPPKFTLTELQTLYEVILNVKLDTRNFRKKILNMNLLTDTKEKQTNVAHRAAKLYSFNTKEYNRLKQEGLNFRI